MHVVRQKRVLKHVWTLRGEHPLATNPTCLKKNQHFFNDLTIDYENVNVKIATQ